MKKSQIIAVALVLASAQSFAAERSIAKSHRPTTIVVAHNGSGLAQFPIIRSDFPNHAVIAAPKKIESISWSTTHYPEHPTETVDICYSRPYRSSSFEHCEPVNKNSMGTTSVFNVYAFDMGAQFIIRHKVNGGRNNSAAAGVDTLTINYSY